MPVLNSVLRSAAATGLVAGALTLSGGTAHAAGPAPSPGKARAVTAELALDVSLLDDKVDVPVDIALNKVESPARRDQAVLTAAVDGVDRGRPVTLVKAEVGRSTTTADRNGTAASVSLVGADLHAPGLASTLIGLEALSAEASCPVDGQPTAKVTAPARVTVLGRSVALGLNGPTHVDVPGVGSVDIEFSRRTTTSSTAAASALKVDVAVNPLNLNVAKVTGTITVASVSCEKPVPAGAPATPVTPATPSTPAGSAAVTTARAVPAADTTTAAGRELASTGSSGTGRLVATAGALIAAGTGALWLVSRRRRNTRARHR
ncbi:SCO1860 family LAETG-anchored protein [Kitasatospora sp. NPDC056138]|uniref:SCO1860 family LAETG-anchored protein n=1 Tax=Kitasatospora sp. NPDC056138 TaxID=3345724 RepID=UPI0035D8DF9F